MPNTELLLKTLNYIEHHPNEWNQAEWRCSSGMCFAGTAIALSDNAKYKYPTYTPGDNERVRVSNGVVRNMSVEEIVILNDGTIDDIEDAATRILELDREDAEALFDGSNNLKELRFEVMRLTQQNLESAPELVVSLPEAKEVAEVQEEVSEAHRALQRV